MDGAQGMEIRREEILKARVPAAESRCSRVPRETGAGGIGELVEPRKILLPPRHLTPACPSPLAEAQCGRGGCQEGHHPPIQGAGLRERTHGAEAQPKKSNAPHHSPNCKLCSVNMHFPGNWFVERAGHNRHGNEIKCWARASRLQGAGGNTGRSWAFVLTRVSGCQPATADRSSSSSQPDDEQAGRQSQHHHQLKGRQAQRRGRSASHCLALVRGLPAPQRRIEVAGEWDS